MGRARLTARRLTTWSLRLRVGFLPWTVVVVGGTAALAVATDRDPDQPFGSALAGTEWLLWGGAALLWVLPLLAGALLGGLAVRRGGDGRARLLACLNGGLAVLILANTALQASFA